MSELQIAWLELGIVGRLGAIFVFVGIIMVVVISRKNKSCTRQTNGVVTGHRFPGQGKMYPIIEYIVDGNNYQTKKQFRGVKVIRISGFPIHVQSKAYEDDKGWLHIKIGPLANLRQLAEQLWPIGSKMTVYYNPDNPEKCYVERPFSGGFTSTLFIVMGLVTISLSVLVFFLIQL